MTTRYLYAYELLSTLRLWLQDHGYVNVPELVSGCGVPVHVQASWQQDVPSEAWHGLIEI